MYRQAVRCNPGNPKVRFELGCCLASMGRMGDAIVELSGSLEGAGSGAVRPELAHLELGMALVSEGLHRRALDHLQEASAALPHIATLHHAIGVALAAVGQVDLAVAAFSRALALAPNAVESMQGMAAAQAAGGDHAAAVATLRGAVRLVGDDAAMLALLGDALLQEGQLAEAEALYVRGVHLDPASTALADRLANLRFPVQRLFALLVAPSDEDGVFEADLARVKAALQEDGGYLPEHVFSLSGSVATPQVTTSTGTVCTAARACTAVGCVTPALHPTAPHHTTAHGSAAQHSTAQQSTEQHSTAQHSARHSTAHGGAAQYSTAQHSTPHHTTPHHTTPDRKSVV